MARNKSTKLTLDVPDHFTAEQRQHLAEKVIDAIVERSKKGLNVFGRDWSGAAGKYTEAYAKKKGVGKNALVDLSLSHDMLDGMQILDSDRGEITIGYEDGSELQKKAEGNILGSYGRAPNSKKARPFLDILAKDLRELIDEVDDV